MKLREYQETSIRDLRALYAAGRRAPCLVMPTGSGKTPTAAEIIRATRARGRKALFLAGRLELLDQAVVKLADAGVTDVRIIQAERDGSPADVTVASVPTLASPRWIGNLPPADLVVIDEVHHLKARTWLEVSKHYARSFLLGLTATPQRGDGSPLGDVLDSMVVGTTVKQLTDAGHLVPCRVYAPPQILDARSLALDPVDAYEQYCAGTLCVVFCSTVEHASRTAEAFRVRGIAAEHVSGDMPTRSDVISRFKAGEFRVLINVSLVVEGFDHPPIASAILARRFTHAGGYLQAIGRILRPASGKTLATVVDLCGSALVHGTPDLEREYSLTGKAIRTNDRESLRQCQSCGGVSTAAQRCPYCSAEFPTAQRALPQSSGVGVEEVAPRVKPTSWPMRAKKRGLCAGCGRGIEPGTWIVYSASKRTAQHTRCAPSITRAA